MVRWRKTSRTLAVVCGGLMGCTDAPTPTVEPPAPTVQPVTPPATPWAPILVETPQLETTREVLATGVGSVAPLGPADLVVVREDRVERLDPLGVVDLWGFALPPLRAAVPWGTATLLATDDGLVTWDDGLVPTGLDDLVEDVTQMVSLRSGLWLNTEMGLVVWRDGVVQAVTVDGNTAAGMARGRAGVAPVVWTSREDQVVAVNFTDAGLTPYEAMTLFGDVQAVAADDGEGVFALVDGWLVARTDANVWERLDVGAPVRELLGHDAARVVWVRTDTAWLAWDGETWWATDVPLEVRGVVDGLGRLVVVTEAGVERFGIDRPLLLVGVPEDNVLAPATVQVVPSARDLEPALSATATGLMGTPVGLPIVDGAFVLDPEVLGVGLWSVAVEADYGDGVSAAAATVTLGADFVPTWPDHIEPIYQSSCRPCHEPGQSVVALDNEANWIAWIDVGSSPTSAGILERVRIDNMPSDNRTVDPIDKALLEVWAAGL